MVLIAGCASDAQVGEIKVAIQRQMAAGQTDKLLTAFYTQREFVPAWRDREKREHLRVALQSVNEDGLHAADYPVAEPGAAETPDAAARRDIDTTRQVLRAFQHLDRGRLDPRTLDSKWNFVREPFDGDAAVQALEAAADRDDFVALLDSARPQHRLYQQLRAGLQRLRTIEASGGWPSLPQDVTLKPGDRDDAVPTLRERLRTSGDWQAAADDAAADPRLYDATLEAALRRFQAAQYLGETGVVDAATRTALNVPVADRIGQLRANLERARWMLDRREARFVMVDIAGYRASYVRDGEVLWQGRIQVGQPYRRTPSFESKITSLTLNPTWTVPPTVLRKDILPKLRADPQYLKKRHIRVLDAQGKEHAPARVDLGDRDRYLLRQDPGPDNALGRVVIRFANSYSVYMHDTPSQALFDEDQRAFSSGCIRIERAMDLAERLLDDPERWNRPALDAAVATGKTQEVRLREPVRLLLTYWTVDVAEDGRLAFRPDIYDRDPAILQALDGRQG